MALRNTNIKDTVRGVNKYTIAEIKVNKGIVETSSLGETFAPDEDTAVKMYCVSNNIDIKKFYKEHNIMVYDDGKKYNAKMSWFDFLKIAMVEEIVEESTESVIE